jgi:nucleotide-binding universal stress UspA family protein
VNRRRGPFISTARPRPRWQTDRPAAEIMYGMFDLAQNSGIKVLPVHALSESPAVTIIDVAATLDVDMLMLGAPRRSSFPLGLIPRSLLRLVFES